MLRTWIYEDKIHTKTECCLKTPCSTITAISLTPSEEEAKKERWWRFGNTANLGGGGIYIAGGTVTFKDSAGNIIATWPGYDTVTDPYGFFTPHNTPNDID